MLRQISLQDSVVYGPVRSRRLGNSLGINPLPTSRKACSSNCVYCQYGWTLRGVGDGEPIKRAAQLLPLIDEAFQAVVEDRIPVDCITFAGNGEPTLHPDLEELVHEVKRLRDRHFPRANVGILSDATQAHRPGVARALRALEVRYMKLDGGDEAMWRAVTQPLGAVDWTVMVAALKNLPDIILQSMFIQGSVDNTQPEHLETWIRLVGDIRPLSVQVYAIDRAPADSGITEVPLARLSEIAALLTQRTGIPAEVYD
jgi:wyosine [tRNA(Phe)-imidazoG37] synthetase (radical SAM superfamily)